MNKIIKVLIFIICIVLVAGIVYFLIEKPEIKSDQNNEQNVKTDVVADIIKGVEQSAGVNFISKGATSFEWILGGNINGSDRKTISGVLYQINNATMADYGKIESFLTMNYEENINTAADGVTGGQRGFIVDSKVCLLSFRHNQLLRHDNAPMEVVGDSRTIKLECGGLN